MASPNSPEPKTKKRFDKETILTIAGLVVVGAALTGWLLYNNHQSNQRAAETLKADKARFAQLEKDMQAAYDKMVADLEKPMVDGQKKTMCDRTSQKFAKGDLYCSVSHGVAYRVANYDAALDRLGVLVHRFDENQTFKPDLEKLDKTLGDRESTGYKQAASADIPLKNPNGFTCKIYMQIDKSAEAMAVAETEGRLATYAYTCLNTIEQPVYPLAE